MSERKARIAVFPVPAADARVRAARGGVGLSGHERPAFGLQKVFDLVAHPAGVWSGTRRKSIEITASTGMALAAAAPTWPERMPRMLSAGRMMLGGQRLAAFAAADAEFALQISIDRRQMGDGALLVGASAGVRRRRNRE